MCRFGFYLLLLRCCYCFSGVATLLSYGVGCRIEGYYIPGSIIYYLRPDSPGSHDRLSAHRWLGRVLQLLLQSFPSALQSTLQLLRQNQDRLSMNNLNLSEAASILNNKIPGACTEITISAIHWLGICMLIGTNIKDAQWRYRIPNTEHLSMVCLSTNVLRISETESYINERPMIKENPFGTGPMVVDLHPTKQHNKSSESLDWMKQIQKQN